MQTDNSKTLAKGNIKAASSASAHIRQALEQLDTLPEDLREELFEAAYRVFYEWMISTPRVGPLTAQEREVLRAFRAVIRGGNQ